MEIWLTEFNMLDNNNFRIGTCGSHGLFNSVMALKYLETEAITKVISHTLTSDGIYGNILSHLPDLTEVYNVMVRLIYLNLNLLPFNGV
ncbi:MAG: hypothetical protein IPJ86_06265 [Bacteroidetes bacterium]|nr:hypothetical protein [Bacteroidota bacterium]